MISPIEMLAFGRFEKAAGAAGVFELRLRLLCDSAPETEKTALKSRLSDVLEAVLKHWGRHLTEPQKKRLDVCVKLRNKIFHQELSKTRGHLISLGEELERAGVWQMNFETGEVSEVEKTSTVNGKIYGWLLASIGNGAFERCVELFSEGARILATARDAALAESIDKMSDD